MSPDAFVLDASVLVAAVLPNEPFHPDAKTLMKHLLDNGMYVFLPTIAFAEVAAAIARGTGDEKLALAVVAQYATRAGLRQMTVDTTLGNHATELAARQRIRGCDAVYVALADRERAVLITLDGQQRQRASSSIAVRTPAQALREFFTDV